MNANLKSALWLMGTIVVSMAAYDLLKKNVPFLA